MEKILFFLKAQAQKFGLKAQAKKYGWKFWFSAVMGFCGALGLFIPDSELKWWEAILWFIPMWAFGYYMMLLVFLIGKTVLKGTGKAAKTAGKVAVAAGTLAVKEAVAMVKDTNTSGNRNGKTDSVKEVNKVWIMRYIGTGRSDGPDYLQVPSSNSFGRPTGNEIKEALISLGYDRAAASSLASGGGESSWEVIG